MTLKIAVLHFEHLQKVFGVYQAPSQTTFILPGIYASLVTKVDPTTTTTTTTTTHTNTNS